MQLAVAAVRGELGEDVRFNVCVTEIKMLGCTFELNKNEDHKVHEGFKKKCCTFAVILLVKIKFCTTV